MNIRKTLLLVLVIVIASLGLTACEQKSEPAPTEQATEAVEEAAEEATEEVEEATEEHPTGEHPTGEHPQ